LSSDNLAFEDLLDDDFVRKVKNSTIGFIKSNYSFAGRKSRRKYYFNIVLSIIE